MESKRIFSEQLTQEQREKVQDDYYQYFRAVPKDKETKILISHKSDCKAFGDYLVAVFKHIDPELLKRVIFTSDPKLTAPRGQDIFDYLKETFCNEIKFILDSISYQCDVERVTNAVEETTKEFFENNKGFVVPSYFPVRSFQVMPVCQNCKSQMHLCPNVGGPIFKCDNPTCNVELETKLNHGDSR